MPDKAPPNQLAVVVLTRDNIRTIERTIRSATRIASHVVVIDSGSRDGTVERCREAGAEVIHHAWRGISGQRQFGLDHCRDHRWILALDSDESIEPDLGASLLEVIARDDPAYDGWMINRKVWFLGDWLRHTFQPEWRLRLVRGGVGKVLGTGEDQRGNHDRVVVPGRVGKLPGICRHDSWEDLHDLSLRQIRYAENAARHDPRGGHVWNILVNPLAAFLKQYVIKRGFLDGTRGVIAAGAVASGTLMKHLFIAQRRLTGEPPDATRDPRAGAPNRDE